MSRSTTGSGRRGAAGAPEAPDSTTAPDTGWFVYAVVDAAAGSGTGPAGDDLLGVDDVPVETVAHGAVAAVVSRFALDRPAGRSAELLAYHRVVDALASSLDAVVPVRFGSVLAEREDVAGELLRPDEAWFTELLEGVRSRSQLVVQAHYDQDVVLAEVVAAEPEVAHLRELTRGLPEDAARGERVRLGELVGSAVDQRRAEDSAAILDVLLPHATAHVLRPASGLERVLDVALLVDADQRDALETRLEVLAEEVHGRIRLRLMGPTAPYDFVGEG